MPVVIQDSDGEDRIRIPMVCGHGIVAVGLLVVLIDAVPLVEHASHVIFGLDAPGLGCLGEDPECLGILGPVLALGVEFLSLCEKVFGALGNHAPAIHERI